MSARTITLAQAADLHTGMEADRALLAQMGYQDDANALLEAVDALQALVASAQARNADVVVEEEFLDAITLYTDVDAIL